MKIGRQAPSVRPEASTPTRAEADKSKGPQTTTSDQEAVGNQEVSRRLGLEKSKAAPSGPVPPDRARPGDELTAVRIHTELNDRQDSAGNQAIDHDEHYEEADGSKLDIQSTNRVRPDGSSEDVQVMRSTRPDGTVYWERTVWRKNAAGETSQEHEYGSEGGGEAAQWEEDTRETLAAEEEAATE